MTEKTEKEKIQDVQDVQEATDEEMYDYHELFLCLAPLTYEEIEQMRINDKPRKKEIINE